MYANATFVYMGHMCIIVYICLFHLWLIHLPNTKASPKFEKKKQPSNAGRFPRCGSLQLPNLRAPPWYWHYNRYLPCQVDPARSPRSLFCTKVVPTWKLLTTRWYMRLSLEWSTACHFMSSSWQPMKKPALFISCQEITIVTPELHRTFNCNKIPHFLQLRPRYP